MAPEPVLAHFGPLLPILDDLLRLSAPKKYRDIAERRKKSFKGAPNTFLSIEKSLVSIGDIEKFLWFFEKKLAEKKRFPAQDCSAL